MENNLKKVREKMQPLEADELSTTDALTHGAIISTKRNTEEWLLTCWSANDLRKFDKVLTGRGEQYELDDHKAITLIEDTLSGVLNEEDFNRNVTYLETCYSKPAGTLVKAIFQQHLFEPEAILSLLQGGR